MTTRRVTDEQLQELAAGLTAGAAAAAEFLRAWAAKLEVDDDQEPGPDPGQPVTLKPRPTVTTEQDVTLVWDAVPGASSYVVGRDGQDRGGHGAWTERVTTTSHTFRKLLAASSYVFAVEARDAAGKVLAGGSANVTTLAEPEVPPPGPAAPGGRFSGMVVPSLVFLGGDADRAAMEARGRERGVPFDGVLTFPGRGTEKQILEGLDKAAPLVRAGLKVVYSIPHAPESEGDQMNAKGAKNAYAGFHRRLAERIVQLNMATEDFVIRANWEFNGNWYRWSANRPGGAAALRDSLNHFRDNVEQVAGERIVWDLCCNKLPSQSGVTWREVLPKDGRKWVLGMDQYDHWGPSKTRAQWEAEIRKGIALADDTAAELGHRWSLDETGHSHGPSGGGDNPAFWEFMLPEILKRSARCAWWNEYQHDGAPATLRHRMPQHNPRGWVAYKAGLQLLIRK